VAIFISKGAVMRINKLIAIVALGLLVFGVGQAKASTMFGFSYSGTLGANSVSGSGTLFGTDLGSGTFLLTSGSGTSSEAGTLTLMTAGTYTNLLAPTDNLTSDNLLTPGSNPTLSDFGIVFSGSSLPSNSQFFNIWGNSPNNYTYFNNWDGPFPAVHLTLDNFTITNLGDVVATPLPAALPLFAGGLGVIGLLARRKKRKAAPAVAAA
jgi:hypothetical protein